MTDKIQINACIITSPYILKAGITPLSNLIEILESIYNKVYVISGVAAEKIPHGVNSRLFIIDERGTPALKVFKVIKYVYANLKICKTLLFLKSIKSCYFMLGERPLLIAILFAKIIGKEIIYISTGSLVKQTNGDSLKERICGYVEQFNHCLSDRVVLYSSKMISSSYAEKLGSKIVIAPRHFVDTSRFHCMTDIKQRDKTVGYIGRFDEEKGTRNFIHAANETIKKRQDINFLMIGDGKLRDEIEGYIESNDLARNVTIVRWLQHDNLPKYMNMIKLIVIPSYTEGLPNVMLESMACGTPVLATPVGGIPDIITQGETGFLLKSNDPECISKEIIALIENPNLERVSVASYNFIEENFTVNRAIERYTEIFGSK